MIAALLLALTVVQAPVTQPSDEDVLRGLVQQYFDAQTREDADAVLAFWSPGAEKAPTRAMLTAVFAAVDDAFRLEVRRVDIEGDTARLRILVQRTRTRPDGGHMYSTSLVLETWSRAGASWKLVDERPVADAVADALIAAPPDRWSAMLAAEDPALVRGALRMTVASRGSMAAASQQYAKAIPPFTLLREIGRSVGDLRVQMEALQNVGNANFFLRRYQQAGDAYTEELALAREAHEPDYEAAALDGSAMVAYSRGDYSTALDGYRAVLDLAERRTDSPAIARALVSVGNVQYLQGDYDLAAGSYRRAISLLPASHENSTTAMAWRGAARVYVAQGDLASALLAQTHALEDARARNAGSEIANDQESIGEIHFRLGNSAEARTAFDDARQRFEALHDIQGAGRLFGDIGLTEVVAERFDAAVAAYTESRKRFEQAKDPGGIGHAWVGIGFSEAGRGRFPDAIDAYKIAIGIFNAAERQEDAGRAWLGLSLAHYGAGDYAAALDDASRVSAIADAIVNDDLAWRARVRAGDAQRRLDRLDEARASFESAIAMIDKIVPLAATSSDARTKLEDSASAWAGLAFTLAEQGDASGALLAAEQRRSHIIRVMLAPLQRDITKGMSSAETAAERATLRTIASLTAQVRAERTAPVPDRSRLDRLQRELAAATANRQREERAIYARLPALKLWRGLRPIASIDQLDAALAPHTLAVEYLATDDQLLVMTASRRPRETDDGLLTTTIDASIVPWTRHDFAASLASALEPASLSDASVWKRRAKPLGALVLAPLTSYLPGKRDLVIVPDDLLWKVPFEALPSGDADVISTMNVSYSSSLYALALRRAPREGATVTFVAAPVLAPDTEAQLAAAAPGWAPQDAEAAKRAVDEQAVPYGEHARVNAGVAATQLVAAAAIERDPVVEIAARMQLSGAAPLFSCALLAPAGGDETDDGRWELREWFDASARGAVLVLPDTTGNATAGLAAAMTALDWAAAAAGVSTVVTGWAPKDVVPVAPLLHDFHAAHAAGLPASAAYSAAIATARSAVGAAPARWAGLRVLGRLR
jgi:tetratricopeptide (TPR) repeat protein